MKLHVNNWGLIAWFAANEAAGRIRCEWTSDEHMRTWPL